MSLQDGKKRRWDAVQVGLGLTETRIFSLYWFWNIFVCEHHWDFLLGPDRFIALASVTNASHAVSWVSRGISIPPRVWWCNYRPPVSPCSKPFLSFLYAYYCHSSPQGAVALTKSPVKNFFVSQLPLRLFHRGPKDVWSLKILLAQPWDKTFHCRCTLGQSFKQRQRGVSRPLCQMHLPTSFAQASPQPVLHYVDVEKTMYLSPWWSWSLQIWLKFSILHFGAFPDASRQHKAPIVSVRLDVHMQAS